MIYKAGIEKFPPNQTIILSAMSDSQTLKAAMEAAKANFKKLAAEAAEAERKEKEAEEARQERARARMAEVERARASAEKMRISAEKEKAEKEKTEKAEGSGKGKAKVPEVMRQHVEGVAAQQGKRKRDDDVEIAGRRCNECIKRKEQCLWPQNSGRKKNCLKCRGRKGVCVVEGDEE
jgi:hypothetical protein